MKRLALSAIAALCLVGSSLPAQGTIDRSTLLFSSRRRHTRFDCDWSSDVCSSDLIGRDHDLITARLKSLQRRIALGLAAIGMHRDDGEIVRLQQPGQMIGAAFGAAEN